MLLRRCTRPGHKDRLRDKVWQTIRIMRSFTHPDLITATGASYSEVHTFVLALRRAGVVIVTHRSNSMLRRHQTMLLVRDLGPLTPRRSRDGSIYDPNSHAVLEAA